MDKKTEKKRVKLQKHIDKLEADVRIQLGKKTSDTAEIDVPGAMRKIAEAKAELAKLQ